MAPALLAIALSLMSIATGDAKTDARTPAQTVVARLTSPFDSNVVWHESEAVFLADGADVVARVEDSFVPLGQTTIRLRDGFSRRTIETIHARF